MTVQIFGLLIFLGIYVFSLDHGLLEAMLLLLLYGMCRMNLIRGQGARKLEAALSQISRRGVLPYLFLLGLTMGARLAMLPLRAFPVPYVPDEFSHQLLAGTLLAGRLTNPTHPLWRHFESIHIFHVPTYSSMYLPGQALFLTAGKAILGHYWWGVWLSSGAFSCALFWMLRGWFAPRWALMGAIIAALRIGISSYWMNSYWGGFPAAIGGALVVGAIPRLRDRPSYAAKFALGLGIVLLAITRPYEGAILTVAALGYLAWIRRLGRLPLAMIVVLAGGVLLACYCKAVTGDPFKLPYTNNRELYGWPMSLAWFQPAEVPLRHKEMRDYLAWETREHLHVTDPRTFLADLPIRLCLIWRFYCGFSLSILVFLGRRVLFDPRIRPLLFLAAATACGAALQQSWYPHYYAPAAPCLFALMLQAFRRLRTHGRSGARLGLQLSRVTLLPMPLLICLNLFYQSKAPVAIQYSNHFSWLSTTELGDNRAKIAAEVTRFSGEHVILVRYDRDIDNSFDWVYNEPDIDSAKLIWARDMGGQNQELRDYYPRRNFWLVEPDADPIRLRRWPDR